MWGIDFNGFPVVWKGHSSGQRWVWSVYQRKKKIILLEQRRAIVTTGPGLDNEIWRRHHLSTRKKYYSTKGSQCKRLCFLSVNVVSVQISVSSISLNSLTLPEPKRTLCRKPIKLSDNLPLDLLDSQTFLWGLQRWKKQGHQTNKKTEDRH